MALLRLADVVVVRVGHGGDAAHLPVEAHVVLEGDAVRERRVAEVTADGRRWRRWRRWRQQGRQQRRWRWRTPKQRQRRAVVVTEVFSLFAC